MNKKQIGISMGTLLLLGLTITVIMLLHNDICSDDIRGYEKTASSSVNAIGKKFRAITETKISLETPPLEGLNVGNFSILKAADTSCKLLNQCLRFVLFTPPSQACPNEYSDYKKSVESAQNLFGQLTRLESHAEQAFQNANRLAYVRKNIEILSKSNAQLQRQEIKTLSASTIGRASTEDTFAAASMQDTIAAASTEDTIAAASTQDTFAAASTQDTIAAASTEDTFAAASTQDTIAAASTEDTIAGVSMEDTSFAASMEDAFSAASTEDTFATASTEDTFATASMKDRTSTRLAILKALVQALESNLSQKLSVINQEITSIVSQKNEAAE